MSTQKIYFTNAEGQQLAARIEFPINQKPQAFALFAHCFTCSKNLTAIRTISKALTQSGFAVLRFDFTGLGESEGDFADTNFSSNIQDLIDAAKFLEQEYEAPKLLVGHSLGGAAVIFAGKMLDSVQAIATIAAPASPTQVEKLMANSIDEITTTGVAEVSIGGRKFNIKKQFIDNIAEQNMETTVRQLKKALLILHSPQDKTVGIENASKIYSYAMHPKSFISLDGADHLLKKKADSDYCGNVIASWASRYVDVPEKKKLKTDKQVIAQLGKDGFTTSILAGRHPLTADEPISVGGNDYGPSPYELLLSSLGACTVMTLRMYVNRKGWEVDEITVHLSHAKDYAKDCADCEKAGTKIDVIDRQIEIIGNVDQKQKERMLMIANKCPVHKTLHGIVEVSTALI